MGKVVGGRYRLIGHLGGGAVSDVSLARVEDGPAGALAVVKRLKLGTDADPDLLAQFTDEARVSLRLTHPNIAHALAAGEDGDGPFLVFEYLDGQTLARIRARASRRAGGVPRAVALRVVMEVANGLAFAHDARDDSGKPLGIIHRDVSPENIIVTYAGETKLIDFSVATAKMASVKGRAGATKGNISYMAPEQGKASVNIDARADVFATGLVLWELLAGKRLWEGVSEADVLTRLADDGPLPTLRSVVPDIPEALDAICTQALAKLRDDRFESAAEMHDAIAKATKALGLETTAGEVGAFVSSLFEDEREKMKATVNEAALSRADSSHSLPLLPAFPPSSSSRLPASESEPKLPPGAAPPAGEPVRVVEVLRVETPSQDRRFTLAVGGAVLIALAVVAVVAITHRGDPKPIDEPLVSTPPAPAATSAEPAVSAYVEPEEVTIEISVTPRTAQLVIDGVKAPSSVYRARVVRGKYTHEVHVEAEGFEPRDMKLAFDRDRTIEIALTPKPHRRP